MVTFTQKHMDAITDLANNVDFQGWQILSTRAVGEKLDDHAKVAVAGAETIECTYIRKEIITLYLNGSVTMRSRLVSPGGMEQFEPSPLALSQLRVLLITAERIASASAESERQWQNYANERDAMDKLTANLIKSAENEKHL